ncbi:ABC transporter permease [Actinomadura cremea]|nr:ABC transporter permease [Actinomadura cremea]
MTRIALRMLRHHRGGFVASFLAMFLGAVIVIGCGGLLETGIRTAAPPDRLAAAPIVVTGDQRFHDTVQELVFPERIRLDAGLAGRLAAVPGVRAAVPDASFPARVGGVDVTAHGWSSTRLAPVRIVAGAAPSGPGEIAVSAGLAERAGLRPGGPLTLLARGAATRYTVSGVTDGGGVFVQDGVAARSGRIDSIGLLTVPGADVGKIAADVEAVVEGRAVAVLTGDERGRAEQPGVLADGGDLIPLAAAFGGLSAMVTVFVVAGTLGLSIRRRQREMALLRAVGATPGQLRRLVLGETLVLAAVATALACYPGPHFGRWLLGAFAGAGVVPDVIAFRSGPFPLLAGAGTALLAAVGAAFVAAHRAARTRPTEALAEAAVPAGRFSVVRLVLGVGCLLGGGALAVGTAGAAGPDAGGVATPAAMVWAIGFGLLGPPLCGAIARWASGPLRRASGLAGDLAARNTRARPDRLAAAVMPVMLASGLALGLTYMQTTQSAGAQRAFDDGLRADLVVTSDAGGMDPGMVERAGRQPGVAAVSAFVSSTGYVLPREPVAASTGGGEEESAGPQPTAVELRGVSAAGVRATTAFRPATGSLDALRGNAVALPAAYAAGHRIGDAVPMRLGDGARVELTLVATLDGPRGYETALVPASILVGHTDSGLVPQLMVSVAPGADHAGVAAALSGLAPGMRAAGPAVLAEMHAEGDRTQASMAYLVLAVVVGYAVISLVNTQVLATAERRAEFRLLRLVGATRGQVLRMAALEAVLVSVAGLALGGLVAGLTLVPMGLSVLGAPVPSGPVWILAAVVGGSAALTLATTLLAARSVLRTTAAADAAG